MTFLDAHIECTHGWLEPLLSHIASDRANVAVPQIDFISSDNMEYQISEIEVNGFDWDLTLIWLESSTTDKLPFSFSSVLPTIYFLGKIYQKESYFARMAAK